MQRVLRCDCGFEATGDSDEELVERAQAHAQDTHFTEVSAELVRALARPRNRAAPPPTTEGLKP